MTDRSSVEDFCEECEGVVALYRKHSTQPNAFIVHVDSSLIEPTSKKEDGGKVKKLRNKEAKEEEKKRKKHEKKILLDELSAKTSALRNTNGGSILVHLCGQKKENRYLGFFDEFATESLTYLIEDGKLYVDTYRRFWLDTLRAFKDVEGFVCINVEKCSGVSVVSFCTKIRNDFEILKPSPLNILTLLKSLALSTADDQNASEDIQENNRESTDSNEVKEVEKPTDDKQATHNRESRYDELSTRDKTSTHGNEVTEVEKPADDIEATIHKRPTDNNASTEDKELPNNQSATNNKKSKDHEASIENKKPGDNNNRGQTEDGTFTKANSPKVRGIETLVLQECRNVEFKSISKCTQITKYTKVTEFVDFVWHNLKLKDNIVSMSKIDEGGSFYVGIAETKEHGKTCLVKPVLEGFETYARPNKYKQEIHGKVSSEILVLNPDFTFADAPNDLITVTFHNRPNRKVILEISVRKFHGLVFSHKEGPLAYTIRGGEVKRMSKEEILTKTLQVYKIKDSHLCSKQK